MERDLKMQNTLSEEGARGQVSFEGVTGRQECRRLYLLGSTSAVGGLGLYSLGQYRTTLVRSSMDKAL